MNKNFLKKVLAIIEEDTKFDPKQIEKGIEIEEEHKKTIERIIEDVKKEDIKSLNEYYKGISLDHLNEAPLYYIAPDGTNRLEELEDKANEDLNKKSAEKEIYPLAEKLNPKEKLQVAKELLENIPEALSGSGLRPISWNYESLEFHIEDEEEGKEYKINKEKALHGLDKFITALKSHKLPGLHLNEKSTTGSFDAEAISAYVQYIIFGKVIYG